MFTEYVEIQHVLNGNKFDDVEKINFFTFIETVLMLLYWVARWLSERPRKAQTKERSFGVLEIPTVQKNCVPFIVIKSQNPILISMSAWRCEW